MHDFDNHCSVLYVASHNDLGGDKSSIKQKVELAKGMSSWVQKLYYVKFIWKNGRGI